MERIEQETEVHRFQKAIKHQLNLPQVEEDILFTNSRVHIDTTQQVLRSPGGQLTLVLMTNLLARMKTAITHVVVSVPYKIPLHPNVPVPGNNLRDGLIELVQSISGPQSNHSVKFDFNGVMKKPTLRVFIGRDENSKSPADIRVEATAWTAYINASQPCADWDTPLPFGPHMAATLAVAEIFKYLLIRNFPQQTERLQIKLLDNLEFCVLTYGADPGDDAYPKIDDAVHLDNIAIAGVGAGGSAALYSLSCIPNLSGKIALIDPGHHKKSNLTRYLLTSYLDCHNGTLKSEIAYEFLRRTHPSLEIRVEPRPYDEVNDRGFRLVVSTVDTPEARWDIQNDWPPVILDAAVVETIYAILRVFPGRGFCLGCKHPYDPDVTVKRRASMWGKAVEEVRQLELEGTPVTEEDIRQLAYVQNQPIDRFVELIGRPFDQVPALTECGDTRFNLQVPNQAATIPFVTTMAGVLIAAEIIKDQIAPAMILRNWFEHNMLWEPKANRYRFRNRVPLCQFCYPLPSSK